MTGSTAKRPFRDLLTRAAAFDASEQRFPLDSYASYDDWSDAREAAGLIDHPPSDWFVERAYDFLEPIGVDRKEVCGLTGMSIKLADTVVRRSRMYEKTKYRAQKTLGHKSVTLAQIKALLPLPLRALPNTALDLENGENCDPLEGSHGARLAHIEPSNLRTIAIVVFMIRHSQWPRGLVRVLAGLERLADVLGSTDQRDRTAVEEALLAYLEGQPFPQDTPHSRCNVMSTFIKLDHLLDVFLTNHKALTEAIADYRIARPVHDGALMVAYHHMAKQNNIEAANNAKASADPLSDDFDGIQAACRVRCGEALLMDHHARRAEDRLLAKDADGCWTEASGSVPFCYRSRAVRADGRRMNVWQQTYMIAHRRSCIFPKRTSDEVVFEFVGVEGDNQREALEPWFIEIFRNGSLLAPSRLTTPIKESRRAIMMRLDLPALAEKPGGLVGYGGKTEPCDAADALRRGVVLIPIHAFAHAMCLAHFMFRVIALTFCRVGEAMQMVYCSSGWRSCVVSGQVHDGFRAIPKGWIDHSTFALNKRSIKHLAVLLKISRLREPSGRIQVAVPCEELKHKCEPAKFVFAMYGRQLRSPDLNYALQFLTAGIGRFRSHNIRYAAANRARVEHTDLRIISDLLRHSGQKLFMADKYSKPTKKQLDEAKERHMMLREAQEFCGTSALDVDE